jgi:hypothetical protein
VDYDTRRRVLMVGADCDWLLLGFTTLLVCLSSVVLYMNYLVTIALWE